MSMFVDSMSAFYLKLGTLYFNYILKFQFLQCFELGNCFLYTINVRNQMDNLFANNSPGIIPFPLLMLHVEYLSLPVISSVKTLNKVRAHTAPVMYFSSLYNRIMQHLFFFF